MCIRDSPVPVAILVQEAGAGVDDRVAPGPVRVPLAIGFVAALAVAGGLGAAGAECLVPRAIGLVQALDADAARGVADGSERLVTAAGIEPAQGAAGVGEVAGVGRAAVGRASEVVAARARQ